VGLSDEDP